MDKNWKKSINYSILKVITEEEKIKYYIIENFKNLNSEKKEINYILEYETIVKSQKEYKIVTKEFLNYFLKNDILNDNNSLSCYLGNNKIIIDFGDKNKMLCKTKMQGDLIYVILQNYNEEEKNNIIITVLKIISYKFLKVLPELEVLKGKYNIIKWNQMIREDDFFYDDLFNDYDPMEYYEDSKFVDQNCIPEKILEIFFLYYAFNLKINRDIHKIKNINEESEEFFFVNLSWMEELKKMYDYEEVIKIIPNDNITYEFLVKNYDIYVHGRRYQKIYSKKSVDLRTFKKTFDFLPSIINLKKIENDFLFINYINNFSVVN